MADSAKIARHRVFVYGSLRRGECNHDRFFRDATAVADGYIRGAELVSLGDYCCIVPSDDQARIVVGEVYDISPEVFRDVEAMEAEAGYGRRPVAVYRNAGVDGASPLAAEAYFYSRPKRVAGRPRIEGGDWLRRPAARGR